MNWLRKQIHTTCTKLNKNIVLAVIIVGVLLFFYLYNLISIAPEYDELLSINAALNCPSNVFTEQVIWLKGNCFPIMLSSYIGGATSIIYRLLFLIVPESLIGFRLLNVGILIFSLLLIYSAAKSLFDKRIAMVTTTLLAIDFQLWFNIRFERTAAIPFFLRSLFIYFIVCYLNKKKNYYLVFLGFIMGISIWTKFDAIFFYAPIILSAILIYRKKLVDKQLYVMSNFKKTLVFVCSFLIGLMPLLYYLKNSILRFIYIGNEVGKSNLLQNVSNKINLFFYQFLSLDAIWYVFRTKIEIPTLITMIILLLWISYFFAFKKLLYQKHLQVIILSLIIFFILFIFYGGMISSHHRFIIYPFPQLALAIYLRKKKFIISKILIGLYLVPFIFSFYQVHKLSYEVGGMRSFSSNIYSLNRFVDTLDGPILIGDWGITSQLLFLQENPKKIREIAFEADTNNIDTISSSTVSQLENCKYLVLHKENEVFFTKANNNLRQLISGPIVYTDAVYEVIKCK